MLSRMPQVYPCTTYQPNPRPSHEKGKFVCGIICAHPNLLFANFFVNLSICFFSWSVVPKAYRLDKYGGSVCCLERGVDLVIPSADRRNHLETQKNAQDDKVSGYLGNIHVEISSCWSLREWNRCFSNKTWQTRYKYSIIDQTTVGNALYKSKENLIEGGDPSKL